jgi:hypothetical protein
MLADLASHTLLLLLLPCCRHAASQLSLGISTIVDCPLARVELYDQAAAIAEQVSSRMGQWAE